MKEFLQTKDKYLNHILKNPLITGSSIVFFASFIANIFNYIFNLSMGRLLSVSDYGLLIALTSLFVLLTVFQVTFSNLFAKFSAKYTTHKNFVGMHQLLQSGGKIVLIFSAVITLVVIISTQQIASFLHVDNPILIVLTAIAIFLALLLSIPIGYFQGQLRFFLTSAITIAQPLIKVIIALILIYIGFEVMGAFIAIVMSVLIPLLATYFILIKKHKSTKSQGKKDPKFIKDFKSYGVTYFLAGIGMTILTSTDIILVRHLFAPEVSGQYAALSLMGKAIFYLTVPINFVFFPLIAQKIERKERLFNTVILALGIVTLVSLIASFVYFTFPGLVLSVFFPDPAYQPLKEYLGFFSLYILVYSLCSLFYNFFLSSGKKVVYKFTLVAGLSQIVLFTLFHDNLHQIITDLLVIVVLLLLAFVYYYMKHGRD